MQAICGVDTMCRSTAVSKDAVPFYGRCLPQSARSTAGLFLLCLRWGHLSQQQGGLCLRVSSFSTYEVVLLKVKIQHELCQCQHVVCAGPAGHQLAALDFVNFCCTIATTTVGTQLSVMVGAVTGHHWPTDFVL